MAGERVGGVRVCLSTNLDVADNTAQVGPKIGKVSFVISLVLPSLFTSPEAGNLNTCKRPAQSWFPGYPKQV